MRCIVCLESDCFIGVSKYFELMKINFFFLFITLAIGCLLGYLVFNIGKGQENDVLYGVGCMFASIVTLFPSLGCKYSSNRKASNIRILSYLIFLITLVVHCCFAGFGLKTPSYIVVNGLILLVYISILYNLIKTNI